MEPRTAQRARSAALVGVVGIAALLAVSGMLGLVLDQKGTAPGTTPPASAPATVDDDELGRAMAAIAWQGLPPAGGDRACLAAAARSSGLSEHALSGLAAGGSDHLGAVIDGLRDLEGADLEALASPSFRSAIDACVDASAPLDRTARAVYEPAAGPVPPPGPRQEEPALVPTQEAPPAEVAVSPAALAKGLVPMLSSFALEEDQEALYSSAGACLAGVVHKAGFTQEALRFIAGGPPIGSGAVSEHLPTEQDRAIWESSAFVTAMDGCVSRADPAKP